MRILPLPLTYTLSTFRDEIAVNIDQNKSQKLVCRVLFSLYQEEAFKQSFIGGNLQNLQLFISTLPFVASSCLFILEKSITVLITDIETAISFLKELKKPHFPERHALKLEEVI